MEDNTKVACLTIISAILKTIEKRGGDPELALHSATWRSSEYLPDASTEELQEIRIKIEAILTYILVLAEKEKGRKL